MTSSVIGGAMLPHAPQFFTMPETEDRNTVERVKTAAAEIGTRLRALHPDLWIIFANDHVEQFFHTAAPPFTIHVGDEAKGESLVANFIGACRARSGSRSCAKCTPKVLIRPSPASPRLITRSASR
jgi:hypothetical protein